MSDPNYILRINEAALMPKKNPSAIVKLRPIIWIVVGIILLSSLFLGENIFSELSWVSRILLVSLAISTLFISTDERVPRPFEIWFYDDYLVLYREHHCYSKKLIRREFDKFYYKDIKTCEYRIHTQRVNFYGIVESKWYNYNKDGSLPSVPNYHKTTDSIRYFYTIFEPDIDIVKEIETNSPVKVEIKNT